MRLLSSTLAAGLLLGLSGCRASAESLFNGHDLSGWELVTVPPTALNTVCQTTAAGTILVSGQPVGYLATTAPHENYRFHAEWRWTEKPGNSGVLVHISSGPKDRAWPLCVQVQTKNKNVGDLLPMAGATFAEPLTSAPGSSPAIKARVSADSEKPMGEWNSCDLVCRGATIEVTINGVRQNLITQTSPRSGQIGFQLEGTPFELRNITLMPLD